MRLIPLPLSDLMPRLVSHHSHIMVSGPPTGADREVQRILLELLNQMDGFDQDTTVKVVMTEYTWGVVVGML